jgi:trehalose 6-phosphate phosphatase
VTAGLPEPVTREGRAGLAALLADPAGALLAFDYDGTLAPIVDDPARAQAHPQAVAVLGRLASVVNAVAIVTGRPAAEAVDLGRFAGAAGLGRLTVLGHYGLERWDAATGSVVAPHLSPGVSRARAELPQLLAAAEAPEGTWVEDKGSSVAVHTRRTADPESALARLREPVAALARRHGLEVQPGRLVLEVRPPGVDKGSALRSYARERSARSVLFAGDDVGDLPAYRAVEQLRREGVPGVKVCSGSDEAAAVAAHADLVVPGPSGVVALLTALAASLHA